MVDIEIKRGYEVLPDNNVRFGIRVVNNSDSAISDVEVILDYSESLFELGGNKIQKLGNIPPTVPRTAKFILKPLGCIHKEEIGATVLYKDHQWKKHTLEMRPKEVHCVCPFLREKSITRAEFLNLSKSGYSADRGINFENISIDKLMDFLSHTCKNRLYKVDEIPVENGKILYLAGESLGEKAYYLLTAIVKEYEGLSQVLLRANSDKNYGLIGFLNEILDNLHHLVQTVNSAREIGIIKKEQVINIIDSVVQRTTFAGGEGAASVNIRDSVVQSTEFKGDEERKRREEERTQRVTQTASPALVSIPALYQKTITNSIGMEFVLIPAGEFDMSKSNESGRSEGPVHRVIISNGFYMGKFEVTQKQWRDMMETNPSKFKGDNRPVEQVSWTDAQEFIKKLNENEGTNKYRLPSEAEWEYAARAGTKTRYSFGDDESMFGDYAWYYSNSGGKTHEVGQKKPNPWGLYDMHGNVWEWVQDTWHGNYNGAPTDGSAWEKDGSDRVARGGSWRGNARSCRSAFRDDGDPGDRITSLGFRLLRIS